MKVFTVLLIISLTTITLEGIFTYQIQPSIIGAILFLGVCGSNIVVWKLGYGMLFDEINPKEEKNNEQK